MQAEQVRDVILGRAPHDLEFWADMYRKIADSNLFSRIIRLETDLHIFHRSVQILGLWGEKTFPGIFFEDDPLPSNPMNGRLRLLDDPISTYLRRRWRLDPDVPRQPPILEQNQVGAPVDIDTDRAIEIFSKKFFKATNVVTSGSSRGIIKFTVNSRTHGYRILVSDEYWYNPIFFGAFSTPVVGNLAPANYKFGGDRGGNIIWDPVVHPVSNSTTSTMVTAF